VLGCNGNGQLGGDDFDRALVNWLLTTQLTDPAAAAAVQSDPAAAAVLLEAAERAKVALSSSPSTPIALPFLPGGQSLDLTLTRGQLEELTGPLLGALRPPLAAVAEECRLAYEGSFDWSLVEPLSSVSSSDEDGASPPSTTSSSSRGGSPAPVKDKYAPKPRQLTAVVLVGGASRMPAVQRALRRLTGLQPRWVPRTPGWVG
jgi:molecular chaperone DnaK